MKKMDLKLVIPLLLAAQGIFAQPDVNLRNECRDGSHKCHVNAQCRDTIAFYTCNCKAGFTGDGIEKCSDINECAKHTANCDPHAECTNTAGNFICTCNRGFLGDGVKCTDVNECNGAYSCDTNALCVNVEGSYACRCKAGFSGNGFKCSDNAQYTPNYTRCGSNWCVDQPGVTCDNSTGKCSCPKGWFVGNGHYYCADRRKQYLCFIHGDPHINKFNGNTFRIPLPCAHSIANLVTPVTTNTPTKCSCNVFGSAEFPLHSHSSDISFETRVDIVITTPRSSFKVRLRKGNDPVTEENPGNDATYIHYTDVRDLFVLNVHECGITITFNAEKGDLTIVSPTKTEATAGLCGNTEGVEGNSFDRKQITDYKTIIPLILHSFSNKSPLDGNHIHSYRSCHVLTNNVKSCIASRKGFSVDFCGLMLAPGGTKTCMENKLDPSRIIRKFELCYMYACDSSTRCSILRSVYDGCPFPQLEHYVTNPNLCRLVSA